MNETQLHPAGEEETEKTLSAGAQSFRDCVLGKFSSHPYWQGRQRRFFQLLSAIPLLLIGLAVAFSSSGVGEFLDFVRSAHWWFIAILATLAFFVGVSLTLLLTARWGELQELGLGTATGKADRPFRLDPKVMGLGIVLGTVLPLLLARATFLEPEVRMLGHLAAVVPMLAVLLGMSYLKRKYQSKNYQIRRRKLLMLVLVILLWLLVITTVHDFAVYWHNTGLAGLLAHWIPWYADLELLFSGAAVLGPLCFLIYGLWQTWPVKVSRKVPPKSGDEKPGIFTRFKDWVKGWFSNPDVEEAKSESCPGWVDALLDQLPAGTAVMGGGPQPLEAGATSRLCDGHDLDFVFDGQVPTEDQCAAFEAFVGNYEQMVEDTERTDFDPRDSRSADLLIEGDLGSGRTMLLRACACYATLARGQNVLILVANDSHAANWSEEVKSSLRRHNLHHYTDVGVMTPESSDGWINGEKPLPSIVISTVANLELCLYGCEYAAGAPFERVREILLLLEVVLVDDLVEMSPISQAHLPFVIDKHRLVLTSEAVPLQVVFTFPPLAERAREAVVQRLFGDWSGFSISEGVRQLHPRPCGNAWRVDLTAEAEDVPAVIGQLVEWCLSAEMDVFLYRRGIDHQESERQKAEFLRNSGGQGSLWIVSDLDQPDARVPDVDAIFYQVAIDYDHCLALRLQVGDRDTVIFSVAPNGEERESRPLGLMPVLADRSAHSLLTSHLKSALRFVPKHSPITQVAWGQFGIAFSNQPKAREGWPADAILQIDNPKASGQAYLERMVPLVSIHYVAQSTHRVDLGSIPEERRILMRDPHVGDRIHLVEPTESDLEELRNQRAEWLGVEGGTLGWANLAHLYDFKFAHAGNQYVATTIRQKDDKIVLGTGFLHGTGSDPIYPSFQFKWNGPEDLDPVQRGGGEQMGISWFSPEDPHAVVINGNIVGQFNDYGRFEPLPLVKFQYRAVLFAIVLDPSDVDSDAMSSHLSKAVEGSWDTTDEAIACPHLSGAVEYAFRRRMPGYRFYARSLAFRLAEASPELGKFVIWIVEPATGGRSVTSILDGLLRSKPERVEFLESIHWFLEHLQKTDDCDCFVRRFARVEYQCETSKESIREYLDAIVSAIAKA